MKNKNKAKWRTELLEAKESYAAVLVSIYENLDPNDGWGRDNIEDEYFSVADDIRILSLQENEVAATSTLRKFPRIH